MVVFFFCEELPQLVVGNFSEIEKHTSFTALIKFVSLQCYSSSAFFLVLDYFSVFKGFQDTLSGLPGFCTLRVV